jgi:membrane associated rhomboid family serine protease
MEQEILPIITYVILAITGLTSYKAFEDPELKQNLLFNAYAIKHRNEVYRLFSHSVIHADWMHLIFNSIVLYNFGSIVEIKFISEFGLLKGSVNYFLLYIGAIVVSSLYSFIKHQDNKYYNALGASGATSAVLYSSIIIFPVDEIYFFGIKEFSFLAWQVGLSYLLYSHYMAKKGTDNIGHDAHIGGALFGAAITILFNTDYFFSFIEKVF